MVDLIMGIGAIGAGVSGLIAARYAWRKLPAYNTRMRQLNRMSATQLHAELTRCTSAIMVCCDHGDSKGARHAHRAMKPIMRALTAERAK